MKKCFAFTLAEVLITLTIIGVIAAITIPNLMQKWQNQAAVSKMSKGYNMLQRMAINIKKNTGCDDLECTGLYNITSSYDSKEFTEKFLELADVKDYKLQRGHTVAIHINCSAYSEACSYNNMFNDYFITQDGLLYSVRETRMENSYSPDGKAIIIFLGTEKRKKSNGQTDEVTYKLGRNMFLFTMYDSFKVEPVTFYSTSGYVTPLSKSSGSGILSHCNPLGSGTGQGSSCAARIITDGWKMNY